MTDDRSDPMTRAADEAVCRDHCPQAFTRGFFRGADWTLENPGNALSKRRREGACSRLNDGFAPASFVRGFRQGVLWQQGRGADGRRRVSNIQKEEDMMVPNTKIAMDALMALTPHERGLVLCWFCEACRAYIGPGEYHSCKQREADTADRKRREKGAAQEDPVMRELADAAEDVLCGGAHDGPCTNEDEHPAVASACDLHWETAKTRERRLRAAVDAFRSPETTENKLDWCHANTHLNHAFKCRYPGSVSLCGVVKPAEIKTIGRLTNCASCVRLATELGQEVPRGFSEPK